MVDFEAVDFANQFLSEPASGSIGASAGAENFLAGAGFALAIGVDDDVACARLRI